MGTVGIFPFNKNEIKSLRYKSGKYPPLLCTLPHFFCKNWKLFKFNYVFELLFTCLSEFTESSLLISDVFTVFIKTWRLNLKPRPFGQITFRSNVLHHHFYLSEVDIQLQNDQGVFGSLVPSILYVGLACWDSMDLYIYFRYRKTPS